MCQLCDTAPSLFIWEGHFFFFFLLYVRIFCGFYFVVLTSPYPVCPYTLWTDDNIKEDLVFEHFVVSERYVLRTK